MLFLCSLARVNLLCSKKKKGGTMRNKILVLGACLTLLVFVGMVSMAAAAEAEPQVGQVVGNVKFPKPMSDEDAKNIGLDSAKEFTLKDVKAPYVLVESMNTT
jgi:hypothetical protein